PQRPVVSGTERLIAGYVVEKDERVVLGRVEPMARDRALSRADVLLPAPPGDPRLPQQRHQVVGEAHMVRGRVAVVANSVIGAAFHPEIVRLARMHAGWVVVLLRVRARGEQRAVQIGCIRVAADLRPVRVPSALSTYDTERSISGQAEHHLAGDRTVNAVRALPHSARQRAAQVARRVAELDWTAISRGVDELGSSLTGPILGPAECKEL